MRPLALLLSAGRQARCVPCCAREEEKKEWPRQGGDFDRRNFRPIEPRAASRNHAIDLVLRICWPAPHNAPPLIRELISAPSRAHYHHLSAYSSCRRLC